MRYPSPSYIDKLQLGITSSALHGLNNADLPTVFLYVAVLVGREIFWRRKIGVKFCWINAGGFHEEHRLGKTSIRVPTSRNPSLPATSPDKQFPRKPCGESPQPAEGIFHQDPDLIYSHQAVVAAEGV